MIQHDLRPWPHPEYTFCPEPDEFPMPLYKISLTRHVVKRVKPFKSISDVFFIAKTPIRRETIPVKNTNLRPQIFKLFPHQSEGPGRCAVTRIDDLIGSKMVSERAKHFIYIRNIIPRRFCPQMSLIHARNHTCAARPQFMSTRAGRHRKILDPVVCENT